MALLSTDHKLSKSNLIKSFANMVHLTTSLAQLHLIVWLGDLVKGSFIHGVLSKSNNKRQY